LKKSNKKVEAKKGTWTYSVDIPKKVVALMMGNLLEEFPVRFLFSDVTSKGFTMHYYYDDNFDFKSFEFIIRNCIEYLSKAKQRVYKKLYRAGKPTKNFHENYILGFVREVKFLFAEQNKQWGLVPCVSKEVQDMRNQSVSGSFSYSFDLNEESYNIGVEDGKNYNKGIYNTGIE
jgi:hypothetical protein